MMRKIVAYSLLFFIFFQLAGYLLIFKTQQYHIRKEIKQRIKAGVSEEELVSITLPTRLIEYPNPIFHWIDKREFRYYGEMFDIVRKDVSEDTIRFYCLSDQKETQLFVNLDQLVKKDIAQNSEKKEQRERVSYLLNLLYFCQSEHVIFFDAAREFEFLDYLFCSKTWIDTPNTPPPRT